MSRLTRATKGLTPSRRFDLYLIFQAVSGLCGELSRKCLGERLEVPKGLGHRYREQKLGIHREMAKVCNLQARISSRAENPRQIRRADNPSPRSRCV